jgi:leader peptidase (prepilin peptidase)/N-methyltransferase
MNGMLELMTESTPALVAVCAVLGAVVGSFLNVVIWRLPRGESLLHPPSHCPACGAPVRWFDNVPVLGYLVLGGRCRACRGRISPEYPLVEAGNAALWGLVGWRFGLTPELPVYMALASALVALAVIDLHHQILPDRITLPGIVVGLLASATLLPAGLLPALAGAALGGGLFFAIAVLSRGGMGGGDVKLIAMIGAFLGWQAVLLTTFLAAVAGGAVGLFLILFFGKGRKYAVPFGPFLSAAALVCLLWGNRMIDWYLSLGRP